MHNPIIRKFNNRKLQSPFIDNIWGADLADMQLISKFTKGLTSLLSVIDIYSKYAWVIPLKDQKGITITNAFQKILDELNHKPNKILVDKGSEFYNRSMKLWLGKNDIEIYSTHNEGKFVFAERFIKTLKIETYKYMNSVSKNVYIDKLEDKVNKNNNTYDSTIKMKPFYIKSNTYLDSTEEVNVKNPKFKIGDNITVSKYKNVFTKDYTPNWSEEVFVIKKVNSTVPWTYVIGDLKGEEIVGTFFKNELQKANQKEFRIEKVIKRKSDKLYVEWKGYDHSPNSWIEKNSWIRFV